jgi:hypothetical protein
LARELAHPGATAPDWSESEWAIAQAAATIHGVSALLAGALKWSGPGEWAQFLADQKAHIRLRFARLQHLLDCLHDRGCAEEIPMVALKGAALHALGVYTAGERPMADIDLLVPQARLAQASRVIVALGFHESVRTYRHVVFETAKSGAGATFGEHAANHLKIELHSRIQEFLPVRSVDLSSIVFPPNTRPGINGYPSRAALLLHLLLHATGALTCRALRLLHLHDIARLMRTLTAEDWQKVREQAACTHGLWWAYPPLALTERYCGGVPVWLMDAVCADCQWHLKHLYRHRAISRCSLSYLWISAFPGIELSRSLGEAMHYVTSRLFPAADALRLRRELALTQPFISGGAWAALPQSRRMLRWLLARQPRQASLHPVYAALRGPALV